MAEDLKIKTAAGKAPLQMLPLRAYIGPGRVTQYGRKKYAPGNYLRATLGDGCGERYAGAALRHLAAMQEDNGLWTRESLGRLDVESGLPELDHAICSLIMLRSILVKEGVLAEDPGEGKDPPTLRSELPFPSAAAVELCDATEVEIIDPPAPSARLCGCGHREAVHRENMGCMQKLTVQNYDFCYCLKFRVAAAIKVV